MNRSLCALAICAATGSALAASPATTGPTWAELHRAIVVIDGDTVAISAQGMATGFRVRAQDYDTPEKDSTCAAERDLAQKASDRLKALATGGLRVTSGLTVDPHGRMLARLWLPDGRPVSAVLISEHLARAYDGRTARGPWCDASGAIQRQAGW